MSEGRVTGGLSAAEPTQQTDMHNPTLRPDENPDDAADLGLDQPAAAEATTGRTEP
jgi:ribose transport system ATP-binding protein